MFKKYIYTSPTGGVGTGPTGGGGTGNFVFFILYHFEIYFLIYQSHRVGTGPNGGGGTGNSSFFHFGSNWMGWDRSHRRGWEK